MYADINRGIRACPFGVAALMRIYIVRSPGQFPQEPPSHCVVEVRKSDRGINGLDPVEIGMCGWDATPRRSDLFVGVGPDSEDWARTPGMQSMERPDQDGRRGP